MRNNKRRIFILRHLHWMLFLEIFTSFCSLSTSMWITDIPPIIALVGHKASLPCNTTTTSIDDSIVLIFWYRNDSVKPVYTVDARDRSLIEANHLIGSRLSSRAKFYFSTPTSFLRIHPVYQEDQDEYRCRVDFKRGPTMNTQVHLSVIDVHITDQNGNQFDSVVGPFNEDSEAVILCRARAGNPRPTLRWWKGSQLMDETSYQVPGETVNELRILLSREDHQTNLSCQATNSNLTMSMFNNVTIDLNLKPLDVNIIDKPDRLIAGELTTLVCHSRGSKPAAQIHWLKDGEKLPSNMSSPDEGVQFTEGNILSQRSVSFIASREDNGKRLSCVSRNPQISDFEIQDSFTLNVHFIPLVSLVIGASVQQQDILEGSDIYFQCNFQSNPSVREIGWSANNETLPEKNHLGRFVSNHTLLVKNVQSYHSGFYKCWATNLIGKGESDYVNLIVKYSPRCKSSGKIYEVDPGGEQPLNLTCEVDAMPADVSFHWSFQEERSPRENSETNLMKFRSYGLKSILTLEPENAWLYKAVYCWAENRIGLQMDPCVFKLHSSKAPDPPVNCTVSNSSTSSLMVKCLPGPNGRLPQVFHLEAYEVGETHSIRKLLRNLTSKESPQFLLDGYPSDIKLSLHLYASNSKGTSETVLLSIKTTHASRWRTDAEEDYIISALPTIAIMVFSAFISVMITAIIAIRRKTRRVHLQRVETSAEIVNPDLCVFSQTLANSAEILDSESLDVVHKTQLDTQSACLDFDVIPNEDSGYSSALTNKNSLTLASVKGLNQKLMAPSVSSPVKLIATVYYTSCANCDHCQNEEEAYGREGLKDSNGEEEESGDLEKLSQCPECGKF